jgi:hypothetical protein
MTTSAAALSKLHHARGRDPISLYIDAFNLYYGSLKRTPFRWLDIDRLCRLLLPRNTIHRIKYFMATVSDRPHDPGQSQRQQTYFRALRTLPNVEVHLGHFSLTSFGCRARSCKRTDGPLWSTW